jgi:RNA polymerase sigma-70 factor (ECF subfamily)
VPLSQNEFAQLFREHYARVYRYVRYQVNDDMAAEDLTAEIFERAYRYRDRFDPARGAFTTWIGNIAHNWLVNYFEQQQRKGVSSDVDLEGVAAEEHLPEAQVIAQEAIARLLACLDQLGPRERQIIAMRFGLNIRNKTIAELMNIKEHTISVILLRALVRLRTCQEEGR